MTPEDLDPGFYLVGREDGTVEPFFVKITLSESGSGNRLLHFHPDVSWHVEQAKEYSGWWWRLMTIGHLPSDKALRKMGPMYGMGGR